MFLSARLYPLLADAVAALVFALIGRETHEHSASLGGAVDVALPFLLALLIGSVASALIFPRRSNLAMWPNGLVIWLCTAVGGMVLRGLFGGGVALSFQIVALIVLGILLLGYRAVVLAVVRGRARKNPA